MKLFRVPMSDSQTSFKQVLVFSGTRYTVSMRFNTRMGRWVMDILSANETPILQGVPLLVSVDFTAQYPTLAVPPGALFVLDDSGKGAQPGLASFVQSHVLRYLDPTQ